MKREKTKEITFIKEVKIKTKEIDEIKETFNKIKDSNGEDVECLYFWGDAGIGKTTIGNQIFESVDFEEKSIYYSCKRKHQTLSQEMDLLIKLYVIFSIKCKDINFKAFADELKYYFSELKRVDYDFNVEEYIRELENNIKTNFSKDLAELAPKAVKNLMNAAIGYVPCINFIKDMVVDATEICVEHRQQNLYNEDNAILISDLEQKLRQEFNKALYNLTDSYIVILDEFEYWSGENSKLDFLFNEDYGLCKHSGPFLWIICGRENLGNLSEEIKSSQVCPWSKEQEKQYYLESVESLEGKLNDDVLEKYHKFTGGVPLLVHLWAHIIANNEAGELTWANTTLGDRYRVLDRFKQDLGGDEGLRRTFDILCCCENEWNHFYISQVAKQIKNDRLSGFSEMPFIDLVIKLENMWLVMK